MSDILTHEVRQEIDHWIKKFPADQKQSAVLQALTIAQKQNGGWLTHDLVEAIATYLEMPKIAVYEVATFYSMYDLNPVGKHKINVCRGISCMLCGSDKITQHLENRLGIKKGETTQDGRYTLREVECLASCTTGPMLQIDDRQYHENLTPEIVDKLLQEIDAKEGQ